MHAKRYDIGEYTLHAMRDDIGEYTVRIKHGDIWKNTALFIQEKFIQQFLLNSKAALSDCLLQGFQLIRFPKA